MDLPEANRSEEQGPAPAPSHALTEAKETRRIVVSPDQVIQGDGRDLPRVSLESVIFRYMAVSAAIIGGVLIGGLLWLALLQ
jgi:hypothetical protein